LEARKTKNDFDGDDTGEVVIGKDKGDLEDGGVVELDSESFTEDKEIIEKMVALGIIPERNMTSLKTFVHMLSTDNI